MKCINCGSQTQKIWWLKWYIWNSEHEIDVCNNCNHIWFDTNEQAFINKDSLLKISQELLILSNNSSKIENPKAENLKCPKCGTVLINANNLTNWNIFSYFMCPEEHWILMSFEDFFKLHDLVRKPKNQDEIDTSDDNRFSDWEKSSIDYFLQKMINENF